MLVLLLAAGLAGLWAYRVSVLRQTLGWQVRRALQLLERADTAFKIRLALDRWEAETRAARAGRTDEIVRYLYTQCALQDQRVRLLLLRLTGADVGTAPEEWQRWHETRLRMADPNFRTENSRDAVQLRPRWVAPVGLTGWFSTIVSLDGRIYVASLGTAFGDTDDAADGVVLVDGSTGSAAFVFRPPGSQRGPRDVIGLAAHPGGLFAACANGVLYALSLSGQTQWQIHAGDAIVAPPLAFDLDRDETADALVITRAGNVLAVNGRRGTTSWVRKVARLSPGADLLGATLALGPLADEVDQALWVTLPSGEVEVLEVRTGRSLRRARVAAGVLAGVSFGSATTGAESTAEGDSVAAGRAKTLPERTGVADRIGGIWWLSPSGGELLVVPFVSLSVSAEETVVAAIRPMQIPRTAEVLTLVCPTASRLGGFGAVCAVANSGLRWRLPLDGAIWGAPAVADLNGDGRPEIVVASAMPAEREGGAGSITVLSDGGRYLARMPLDAAVESSPLIADIDGDHRLEVLVADQRGRLHCFTTDGFGPVQWGTLGGDSHNTRNPRHAYAFGQIAFGHQQSWRPAR